MKRVLNTVYSLVLIAAVSGTAYAGNPQRVGSAGASELLINPYARSSSWADVNVAGVRGVESMYMNVAGLAHTRQTEVIFSHTQWLVGAGIAVNNFGFAQRVSSGGVLGIGITAFDYGEWEITTETQPEGTGGTISPSTLVMGIAYSQKFTNSIFGGVNIKLYNNNITNLNTSGICFDAGVQYITGPDDEWKFGITLRNVGPSIRYSGDGFGIVLPVPTFGVTYSQAWQSRSAQFELPVQLMIGGSYDWFITENNRLTPALAFTSNSFEKDTYHIGLEYGFKTFFMIRAGYKLFDNRFDETTTTALTGFSGGFTFDIPLDKEKGSSFGIDYGFRATNPFSGIHTIGVRLDL